MVETWLTGPSTETSLGGEPDIFIQDDAGDGAVIFGGTTSAHGAFRWAAGVVKRASGGNKRMVTIHTTGRMLKH